MSTAQLNRPGLPMESLLSDQAYRNRTPYRRVLRGAPVPSITMDASQPFIIHFGSEGFFKFDQEPPKWFLPLLTKVCELGNLPPDWNSYGARPIDPETAVSATMIMLNVMSAGDPQPAAVPTSRGGVLLEWHEGGIDLEVDVRSPSSVHVFFEDKGIEEEFENAELELVHEKLSVLRDRLQRATGNG